MQFGFLKIDLGGKGFIILKCGVAEVDSDGENRTARS